MGRGYIYYITKDKDEEPSFDESDYYDRLDALHVDYVQNESSENPLESLQQTLQELGAVLGYGYDKNFAFSFSFKDVDKAKREFFEPRLRALKENVAALTLEHMVESEPAFEITPKGDLIAMEAYYGDSLCSVDDFIRSLESGVSYYVYEKVVFMH